LPEVDTPALEAVEDEVGDTVTDEDSDDDSGNVKVLDFTMIGVVDDVLIDGVVARIYSADVLSHPKEEYVEVPAINS
jgi:hypothetical protein